MKKNKKNSKKNLTFSKIYDIIIIEIKERGNKYGKNL